MQNENVSLLLSFFVPFFVFVYYIITILSLKSNKRTQLMNQFCSSKQQTFFFLSQKIGE